MLMLMLGTTPSHNADSDVVFLYSNIMLFEQHPKSVLLPQGRNT